MSSKSATIVRQEQELMKYGVSATGQPAIALAHGDGATVIDADGRTYLDLFAGAGRCLIGHGHLEFVEAIAEQAGRLIVSRHATEVRATYLEQLRSLLPPHLDHVSIFSTGSEAVDAATRLARERTGARTLIVFDRGFHGKTSGTAPFTDPRWRGGREDPDVLRVAYPSVDTDSDSDDFGDYAVLAQIRQHHRLAGKIAGILIEPVQGTGGNRATSTSFLASLSDLAMEIGAMLIIDEIITGFGRTGEMFASHVPDVRCDILAIGKGMANGLPIGAMVTSGSILAGTSLAKDGALSSTFGGNPLSVAAASITLKVLLRDALPGAARHHGAVWLAALHAALGRHPAVRMVYGHGLMIGISMRLALPSQRRADLERALVTNGLIVGISGNTLRLNPPLVITSQQLATAVAGLTASLDLFDDGSGQIVDLG